MLFNLCNPRPNSIIARITQTKSSYDLSIHLLCCQILYFPIANTPPHQSITPGSAAPERLVIGVQHMEEKVHYNYQVLILSQTLLRY